MKQLNNFKQKLKLKQLKNFKQKLKLKQTTKELMTSDDNLLLKKNNVWNNNLTFQGDVKIPPGGALSICKCKMLLENCKMSQNFICDSTGNVS